MASKTTHHLGPLDLVRGLAILLVVSFHCLYFTFSLDTLPQSAPLGFANFAAAPNLSFLLLFPASYGYSGVSLFFVLSGFVIHYSSLNRPDQSVKSFLTRRFFRIYPPYLLALLAFTLISIKIGKTAALPLQFLSHLTLTHNFTSETFYGINGPFWSLATEAQFYLLYPLLLPLIRRWGLLRIFSIALGFSLLARTAVSISLYTDHLPSVALTKSTAVLWSDWLLGAVLAERFVQGRRFLPANPLAGAGFLLLFLLCPLNAYTQPFTSTAATLAGGYLIESLLARPPKPTWLMRALSHLGLVSYSLYLWHQPLLKGFSLVLHRMPLHWPMLEYVVYLIVGLPLLAAWSTLLYRFIEKPANALGHRLTQPNRSVPKPVEIAVGGPSPH